MAIEQAVKVTTKWRPNRVYYKGYHKMAYFLSNVAYFLSSGQLVNSNMVTKA